VWCGFELQRDGSEDDPTDRRRSIAVDTCVRPLAPDVMSHDQVLC
jgi:hypothetical protein